ncbi:lytic transglycosylase domain-containing protein [Sporosarcina sp. JAI121]|uniref:lytic transglycosylase domain-containing protein n=1 Tax=Sporosarcina sp. JAI121 TaxID=2723064 RepID=UPI0015C9137F|nr:lytic transglycosylase domain-containing protein [Sporosarcina sp. JAI121]NYF24002.1 membrane-bound lytic murein transglycosylase B [Sporosarcina sp. JAI121]
MDTRILRTLMGINSLQSLGAVQTYAGQNDTSASMFTTIMGEMLSNTSITDSLSSTTSTILGNADTMEYLRYSGKNAVFEPSIIKNIQASAAQYSSVSTATSSMSTGGYGDIISQAAEKYNIPDKLISAVIKQESNFNNNSVSHAGAQGLMQLMPGTAKFLGVKNSFDPIQNVMGGAKYLRQMLNQFGDNVELALAAYNAGPGNVKKYDGIPPFKETQQYVKKVLSYFNE